MIVNHISTVMEGSYAFGTQLNSIIDTDTSSDMLNFPILVIKQRTSTLKIDLYCFDMFYKHIAPLN